MNPGKTSRLEVGQSCMVQEGGYRAAGIVVAVQPKGYKVMTRSGERHYGEAKVRPGAAQFQVEPVIPANPDIPRKLALPTEYISVRLGPPAGVAVPKPEAPQKVPVFLTWVRQLACCNCGRPGPNDAHHEGKKGVGQKVRDTLVVPLCRACHETYTRTNQLPLVAAPGLMTRGESLLKLQAAQDGLLSAVFASLPIDQRIELMSNALANLKAAWLSEVLLHTEVRRARR